MLFDWLAGWKISNPLTSETPRKTNMVKVDIVINIFNTHWYISWGKGGRCLGLTHLTLSCADCLEILGASTSWSPSGLRRLCLVVRVHALYCDGGTREKMLESLSTSFQILFSHYSRSYSVLIQLLLVEFINDC